MFIKTLSIAAAAFVLATTGNLTAEENPTTVPPRRLRGYGRVSGQFTGSPDASCLIIDCENDQLAMRTASKYAGDLQALGGAATGRLDGAPVWHVPGRGVIAVRRDGRRVGIVAAASEDAARVRIQGLGWPAAEVDPAHVPMFLDAWDRYGFRFYYRPWELPKNVKWEDYKVLDEFDFAKASSHAGFVFWAGPDETDRGPGLTNRHWWDWAARAAARRNLPVVINTMNGQPTWLLNRYRDQGMAKMPQFCGSYHSVAEPHHDGRRQLSWCATTGKDAQLAMVQRIVREYSQQPNVIEFLEPHGELGHGAYSVFLEYGPVADASYRRWLEGKYGTPAAVSRRWHGDDARFSAWENIRVPELASFLGWGPDAVDLTGAWRLAYEPLPEGVTYKPGQLCAMHNDDIPTQSAPETWFAADFDDSAWPVVEIPGSDRQMFLDKRPAVLRREFEYTGEGPAWLYLWDLNYGKHRESFVRVVLNGEEVGSDTLQHAIPHWGAYALTGTLRRGRNVLAVRVPKGVLAYRAYVSSSPPRQYPALGEHLNAQWVDFSDWYRWTRMEMARRGIEMIRRNDSERSIVCMAPDGWFGGIKELCEDYGAHFHNTGHMGAFWNDYLPALMRGADLPFSLEPGGPARDLPGFKAMMGLYFTEGIQAIHYFIHVGSVMWSPEIRHHFEKIQPLINTIGKVHPPKGEVAMLLSDRVNALTGYPWGTDYNVNLPSGYWGWRITDIFAGTCHIDAVTDRDFAPGGHADPYGVIIDTNTSVMDEATVGAIEAWVRRGGIFVTFVQTGRHTPEIPDSWPISRLTGYRVTAIDPHRADGGEGRTRSFRLAKGQTVFQPDDWPAGKNHDSNGLSLEKTAPECRDLLVWEDGAIAAGLRPLGKGHVVHLGIRFGGTGWAGINGNNQLMLRRVLEWASVPGIPARADGVMFRHYVSNNGLYDVWTLWNRDSGKSVSTRLVFEAPPPSCVDVLTGQPVDPDAGITLPPLETRIYLTPRRRITDAPLYWFKLQRNWWRGGEDAEGRIHKTDLPLPATPYDLDLGTGWVGKGLEEGNEAPAAWADPAFDDSDWPARSPMCWAVDEEFPTRHAFFRRRFTVPEHWTNGELRLWLRSYFSRTVIGTARYWLDGERLDAGDGRYGLIHTLAAVPGSTHLLAVEIRGEGQVCGVRGNIWLSFTPEPEARLNLAGDWTPSSDLLRWEEPIPVPGPTAGAKALRRHVLLPKDWHDGQVYLHLKAGSRVTGVLVNGHYIRRHHHALGDVTRLNISNLLMSDADNELEIVLGGGKDDRIDDIHLRFYDQH